MFALLDAKREEFLSEFDAPNGRDGTGRYGIGCGKVDRDFKHGDGSGMFLPPP